MAYPVIPPMAPKGPGTPNDVQPVTYVPAIESRELQYDRFGVCIKCGQCCMGGDPYGVDPDPHAHCPHLVNNNDGTYACSVRGDPNSLWALGCNVWPTVPEHLQGYDKCSYTFKLKV